MQDIGKEGNNIGILLTEDEYELITYFIGNCIAIGDSDSIIQDTLMDTYKAFTDNSPGKVRFEVKPTKENDTVLSFNRF